MKKLIRWAIRNSEPIMSGAMSGYIGWALGIKMAMVVIFSMALHAMWTR